MSQKALFLPKAHAQFSVGDRPKPRPGPGEILVKVHATALNPFDWKIQGDLALLLARFIVLNLLSMRCIIGSWKHNWLTLILPAFDYLVEYPAILGTDSAGVVEEVGEGVTEFVKGDAVWESLEVSLRRLYHLMHA